MNRGASTLVPPLSKDLFKKTKVIDTNQYNATTDKMVVYLLAKELEFPVIIAGLSDNCLINCLSLTVFSLGIGLASMESTLSVVSQTNPSVFSLVPICK